MVFGRWCEVVFVNVKVRELGAGGELFMLEDASEAACHIHLCGDRDGLGFLILVGYT